MVDQFLKKDITQISFDLRGNTLSGTVTDADWLCFYGLFFLEPDERKQLERRGATTLVKLVQQRQQQMIAEIQLSEMNTLLSKSPTIDRVTAEAQARQQAEVIFDRQLSEAIFFKINNNHLLRAEAASRVIEIFPNIDRTLVNYDPQCAIGSFRLTTQETMTLVMSVLGGLMDMKYEQPTDTAPAITAADAVQDAWAEEPAIAVAAVEVQPTVANPYGLTDEQIAALTPEAKKKLELIA